VDPVRDIGTVAEYYCNYGYGSDSDPLVVECEYSLFWNSSSALNCSQKLCLGQLETKVCYNCGGIEATHVIEEYVNTNEAECKDHINNTDQTSVTLDRSNNMCYVFKSRTVDFITFENGMMHIRKSCNAGNIYLNSFLSMVFVFKNRLSLNVFRFQAINSPMNDSRDVCNYPTFQIARILNYLDTTDKRC